MLAEPKTPVHLWIVGGLSLLWNAFGGYDYVMTQTNNAAYLEMFTPQQRAFFQSFPVWMEAAWALGVWGAIAGSVLLLMRSKHAVWAFVVSLAGLAFSTLWQFGLSGADIAAIMGPAVIVMTLIIWVVSIALLYYALQQRRIGVLK